MVLETPAKEVHSRCLSLEGERGCKAVFLKNGMIYHKCFNLIGYATRFVSIPYFFIRDLKQTTTVTATKTWKNKRSNWQNNSSARAF